jgi:hypothetical protein
MSHYIDAVKVTTALKDEAYIIIWQIKVAEKQRIARVYPPSVF